jgi:hypothetical protein
MIIQGETALTKCRDWAIIDTLMEAGADINHANNEVSATMLLQSPRDEF